MDIMTIITNIEDTLENAKNVPLSSKKMVDIDEFLDLIDSLKIAVPDEVKQSQLVLERETYIIEEAKRNAGLIINEAEAAAKKLVEDHVITQEANEKSKEILNAANENATEIKNGALNYAKDVLRSVETKLSESLTTVQMNLKEL